MRPFFHLFCCGALLFGAHSAAFAQYPQFPEPDQKPLIKLKGAVRGEHISPTVGDGANRIIDTAPDADVSGVTIEGIQARVGRGCIRIHGSGIVIRNVRCSMMGPPKTSMRYLPEGLQIRHGSDIRVENSVFSGFRTELGPNEYWNGDGVAAERGITGLSFTDVQSSDNTDAGFDIKSPVKMDRVSASGNCRDYRFWSDADVGTMRVGQTISRGGISSCPGIWIKGDNQPPGPVIRIRDLVVTATEPMTIIHVDGDYADIVILHCSITAPAGSTMIAARRELTRVRIDPSCTVRGGRPG